MAEVNESLNFENLIGLFEKTHRDLQDRAARSVDIALVVRNWLFGWYIVAYEQNGEDRAQYGTELIGRLADRLTMRGCSRRSLALYRKFYSLYADILQTLSAKSCNLLPENKLKQSTTPDGPDEPAKISPATIPAVTNRLAGYFSLGWSHYVTLLTLDNVDERRFYEIEAARNSWSIRELKRQMASLLYARLALSRDQEKIKELSTMEWGRLSARRMIS